MLQSNQGKPAEEAPTFVVVLPQAYKRHWWNRVSLVEKMPMKILIYANRYRTMGRKEQEPSHARRIVLPACGRLWQAYVEAETGTPSIVDEAIRAGKNPMQELESVMRDVKDEIRRQPSEVGSALVEFMRSCDRLEVLIECLRAPLIHDLRILLRLDDSVDPMLVSWRLQRYSDTCASTIVEAAFGRYLPQDEQAELAAQIAKGARRDFVKEWPRVAVECDDARMPNDARRRTLRKVLERCLLHRADGIREYRATLDDRFRHPCRGFEQYDNVLRHIVTDVRHGGTIKQRAEALGVPVGDVYDYVRRKKYQEKRRRFSS